jgi:hypothetical protein
MNYSTRICREEVLGLSEVVQLYQKKKESDSISENRTSQYSSHYHMATDI